MGPKPCWNVRCNALGQNCNKVMEPANLCVPRSAPIEKAFCKTIMKTINIFSFSSKTQNFTKAILLCTTFFIFRKKLNFMVRSLLRKKGDCFFIQILKIGWMRCTFRLFFLKLKNSWPAILLYKDIVKCWETYIFVGRSPLKLQLECGLDFGFCAKARARKVL